MVLCEIYDHLATIVCEINGCIMCMIGRLALTRNKVCAVVIESGTPKLAIPFDRMHSENKSIVVPGKKPKNIPYQMLSETIGPDLTLWSKLLETPFFTHYRINLKTAAWID